ncbi:MAG: UDP-N-acetylmuramate dehydrogenase [Bacteroidales bacterium]|nr:UDP-N-acetylmuramate dehydrogenase [Bacteroidales bacterium]
MIKTEYYKDLTKMNTFGMKVNTRCFIEYDSVADLVDIEFGELAEPVLHIGGGSNLLFTDDFKGTVLHSKIHFIEVLENKDRPTETLVSVGSGVVFDDFCGWAAREGLWGVENLSYIPGEVGASAVQNIGAYGVEVKDVIRTVYCYDTVEEEFVKFDVGDCGYGYRDSIFKRPEIKGRYIVTHVVFALSREPQPRLDYGHIKDAVLAEPGEMTPMKIRKAIINVRKEKLPETSVMGSAGSFFKNPVISMEHFLRIEAAAKAEHGPEYKVPHYIVNAECESAPVVPDRHSSASDSTTSPNVGREERSEKSPSVKIPAAWMIEQCGWKGRRSGNAAVYDKQPLVIVNYTGEAYPEEITGLERRIIASVKQKFDIELHPEVEHI